MIKLNSQNLNGQLDKILSNLIGKSIEDVSIIKLDPTSENRWANYDHFEISGIRIRFSDRSSLEITQVLEPVDDEDTHPENPLNIELVEYK